MAISFVKLDLMPFNVWAKWESSGPKFVWSYIEVNYFFFHLEKCPFDILIYDFTENEWVESCKTQGTFYFLKRNFAMTIQTNKRRPIIFESHDNYQFHVKPFWHWLEIVLTLATLIEVDFIENVNNGIIFCSLLSVWCLIYARLL